MQIFNYIIGHLNHITQKITYKELVNEFYKQVARYGTPKNSKKLFPPGEGENS